MHSVAVSVFIIIIHEFVAIYEPTSHRDMINNIYITTAFLRDALKNWDDILTIVHDWNDRKNFMCQFYGQKSFKYFVLTLRLECVLSVIYDHTDSVYSLLVIRKFLLTLTVRFTTRFIRDVMPPAPAGRFMRKIKQNFKVMQDANISW